MIESQLGVFEVGDIACLRSDLEVSLTVEEIYQSGTIAVVWFDVDSKLRRDIFQPSMLVKP